jgi:hypothetical protein
MPKTRHSPRVLCSSYRDRALRWLGDSGCAAPRRVASPSEPTLVGLIRVPLRRRSVGDPRVTLRVHSRAVAPAAPIRRPAPRLQPPLGPALPNVGSCSAFVVSRHLGGLLRAWSAGLLRPAASRGVHCVSDSSRLRSPKRARLPGAIPAANPPFEAFPSSVAVPRHRGRVPSCRYRSRRAPRLGGKPLWPDCRATPGRPSEEGWPRPGPSLPLGSLRRLAGAEALTAAMRGTLGGQGSEAWLGAAVPADRGSAEAVLWSANEVEVAGFGPGTSSRRSDR